ncbi:hypothetical protein WN51_02899 [Melipona quadrifasciata]|uniref:Uncharacterized protein n=1 Tax=Melipona quadrifasciata TaxID=166423 RepID=A0A0M9AB32_9HYME|nr:hypothetical protein WN51_02899 [Melipona quadrifasciata]
MLMKNVTENYHRSNESKNFDEPPCLYFPQQPYLIPVMDNAFLVDPHEMRFTAFAPVLQKDQPRVEPVDDGGDEEVNEEEAEGGRTEINRQLLRQTSSLLANLVLCGTSTFFSDKCTCRRLSRYYNGTLTQSGSHSSSWVPSKAHRHLGFLNYEFRAQAASGCASSVEVLPISPTLSKAVCGKPSFRGWVIGASLAGSYSNKRLRTIRIHNLNVIIRIVPNSALTANHLLSKSGNASFSQLTEQATMAKHNFIIFAMHHCAYNILCITMILHMYLHDKESPLFPEKLQRQFNIMARITIKLQQIK